MKQKLKQIKSNKIIEDNQTIKNEKIIADEDLEETKKENSNRKEKIKNICKKVNPIITNVVIAIMPLIIALCIECFFLAVNAGTFLLDIINRKAFAFSVLLVYIIYIIILGITKKTSITVNILVLVSYMILIVNQVKIIYTGNSLVLSDINFLSKIGDLYDLTSYSLMGKIWEYILYFIDLGVCFVLIMIWSTKHSKELQGGVGKRISLILLGLIMIVILFFPNKSMKDFYLDTIFDMKNNTDYNASTKDLDFYTKNTFLAGIWGTSIINIFTEPESYNKEEIDMRLEDISQKVENDKDWGKPNIILLFSESFWDVDKIDEIKFNKKVTENLDEIKENGRNVQLLTCAYGGLSENVAFELLTGASMNYFSDSYIPIASLYKRKNIENAPSIVKNLKQNGYYSKIAFGKDYYKSSAAFKEMGFDEYIEYEETEENKKGDFISDEFITDKIIEEFENKEENKKLFFMAETIQSHMPYTEYRYQNYDIEIEKSTLNDDLSKAILSYAQGMYDASKEINRLYQYIKDYDEPTLIIFLGDHLPYIYTEKGYNAIDYLKYFNTEDELENTYRRYNTEAFIVANYDINYEEVPKYLSDDLLFTYIINQMDINIDDYYKFLYSTINALPAVNKYIALDNKGHKYSLTNMNEQIRAIYELKERMQYRLFIDT